MNDQFLTREAPVIAIPERMVYWKIFLFYAWSGKRRQTAAA